MRPNTLDDCRKIASEIDIPFEDIAIAHYIPLENTLEDLEKTTTQKARWSIVHGNKEEKLREAALQAIKEAARRDLENATTQEELLQIAHETPYYSDVRRGALGKYLQNATTQEERKTVWLNTLLDDGLRETALQMYLENATTQEERWEVFVASSDSKWKALRMFVRHATTKKLREMHEEAPNGEVAMCALRELCRRS